MNYKEFIEKYNKLESHQKEYFSYYLLFLLEKYNKLEDIFNDNQMMFEIVFEDSKDFQLSGIDYAIINLKREMNIKNSNEI